jgi:hypothetical protein
MLNRISIECPQRSRLSRPHIVLLGDWVLDGIEFPVRLYGIRIVFPQSIRIRGRLPRAVISPTKVFFSYYFCDADCSVFVQQ